MKTIKKITTIIAICLCLMSFIEISGGKYISTKSGNELIIKGTSSLHDWEMKAEDYTCSIEINTSENKLQIKSVSLDVTTKSISEGNKIMDKKAHGSLKADEYPHITFDLIAPFEADLNADTFSGNAQGKLNIAGVTKTVEVEFTGTLINPNQIQVTGTQQLKMTDFGITPPTAMMGTLKTGDDVTITFNILYAKN